MTVVTSNWTRWAHFVEKSEFHQFWFENVDVHFWYDFAEVYLSYLIVIGFFTYFGSVWWLKSYMKEKEPFKLRLPLFLWNSYVGLFSIVALYRIGTEVYVILNTPQGFYKSMCIREGLHRSTAFWAVAMCFSKPLLALDTYFLVLRKKPVDAVHMIHHMVAMISTPLFVQMAEPFLRWLGVANLLVHAIDYPLLALRSLQISIPKSRHIMAFLEVVQMLVSLYFTAYTLFIRANGTDCVRHPLSIMITYGIYFSLLFFLAITFVSPEYWKRGLKKTKSKDKTD